METGTYTDLAQAIGTLPESVGHSVWREYSRAMGYVWGRQDAGEGERDSERATRFALAYGWHVLAYKSERESGMRNVQSAWDRWVKGESLDVI